MAYGWINSKTEHMRTLQPPPAPAVLLLIGWSEVCWANLSGPEAAVPGVPPPASRGTGERRGDEDRWSERGCCCCALTRAHWSVPRRSWLERWQERDSARVLSAFERGEREEPSGSGC